MISTRRYLSTHQLKQQANNSLKDIITKACFRKTKLLRLQVIMVTMVTKHASANDTNVPTSAIKDNLVHNLEPYFSLVLSVNLTQKINVLYY